MRRLLPLVLMTLVASPVAAQTPPAQSIPAPQGYTYSAEGRRDPFVSLMRRGPEPKVTTPVPRAPGIAGMTANDISLRGVLTSGNEFLGIVQASDNRTYIVRAGQKLLDGSIRAIHRDEMVIVQHVSDPTAPDRQRELRKVLRSSEAQ